jgi:hypothetical protein
LELQVLTTNVPKAIKRELGLLAVLLIALVVLSCISIVAAVPSDAARSHDYRPAVLGVAPVVIFALLFLRAPFCFGYLLGAPFYVTVIGFVWLTYSSALDYDHERARWSAAASLLCLLLPLLFQIAPLRRRPELSRPSMNRLLLGLLAMGALVLAWAASYGFAFVSTHAASELRSSFPRPTVLNYAIGIFLGAVLPYVFASFAWQKRYCLAALSLMLILAFYPVVLNKTVLFAGAWLPALFLLYRSIEPRSATFLALLIAMLIGVLAHQLANPEGDLVGRVAAYLYGNISIRMFAYPSIAMDRYSDFFAHHSLTHFCQVSMVRALVGCPYSFQLGQEMRKAYDLGNLNASLLATEGIASVGPVWAPLSASICGLALSIGNSLSSRLPPPIVATSAGIIAQALMNVPLTTSFLTNGLFALWLLWLITPEESRSRPASWSNAASSRT